MTGGPTAPPSPTASRVGVLGLGLIGGSVARALLAAGRTVVGWDPDGATRESARDLGVEVLGSVEDLADVPLDLLVLAVPLRAVGQTVAALAPVLGEETVLTDVASVKAPVRAAVVSAGLGERYVGAHPMAGTEHSGFDASDADLLRGARWALTLDASTRSRSVLLVAELVTTVFDGVVVPLTDDVHDEATALISHVPHVVATELLNLVARAPVRPVALGLAAGSFRDGTRVARTTPRRTQAMVTDNAPWVAAALRRSIADLTRLALALETHASTDEFFDRADLLRSGEEVTEVVRTLVLDDGPGWQARLTDLGARGAQVLEVDAAAGTLVVSAPAELT